MPRLSFPGGASHSSVLWVPSVASTDTTLLAGETDGLSIDFTLTSQFNLNTWSQAWNQVRTASVDTFSSPYTFYTQSGTSPKVVATSATGLGWSPHNILLRSQEFDNGSWTWGNSTVSANTIASPDGTTTADTLIENSSSSTHKLTQSITQSTTTQYTLSVYAKAKERTRIALQLADNTDTAFVVFDLSGGQVATTPTGNWTSKAASIQSIGSGWYRCILTAASLSDTSGFPQIFLDSGSGTGAASTNYTGDGASGAYLWGAQINLGPVATTYIATTSAIVYGLPISYGQGLLVEPAATNICLRSQEFNNAAWTTANVTLTTDAATGPDGTTTAERFLANGGGTCSAQQVITVSSGAVYTGSIYLKVNANDQWARISMYDGSTNGSRYWFDLTNGVIGSTVNFGSGWTAGVYTITNIGNGWYRITATVTTGGTSLAFFIASATADASTAANTTSDLYYWGGQVETGSIATSHIPTQGSTVTRAVDKPNVATSSAWIGQTLGSYWSIATCYAVDGTNGNVLLCSDDGSTNNVDQLFISTASAIAERITAGGVASTATTGNAITAGTQFKAAGSWDSVGNTVKACLNAGTVASTTAQTPTGINLLQLGERTGGSAPLNGLIAKMRVLKRAYSSGELQTKTT